MSIENLKKILESEREEEMGIWDFCTGPVGYRNGHGNATDRLLPLLEKAVKMAEFYNGLYVFDESDDDSEQLHIDKPWRYASGKRAREFLSYFTKMTEIKKESGK